MMMRLIKQTKIDPANGNEFDSFVIQYYDDMQHKEWIDLHRYSYEGHARFKWKELTHESVVTILETFP